jgi:hypothetical protein
MMRFVCANFLVFFATPMLAMTCRELMVGAMAAPSQIFFGGACQEFSRLARLGVGQLLFLEWWQLWFTGAECGEDRRQRRQDPLCPHFLPRPAPQRASRCPHCPAYTPCHCYCQLAHCCCSVSRSNCPTKFCLLCLFSPSPRCTLHAACRTPSNTPDAAKTRPDLTFPLQHHHPSRNRKHLNTRYPVIRFIPPILSLTRPLRLSVVILPSCLYPTPS